MKTAPTSLSGPAVLSVTSSASSFGAGSLAAVVMRRTSSPAAMPSNRFTRWVGAEAVSAVGLFSCSVVLAVARLRVKSTPPMRSSASGTAASLSGNRSSAAISMPEREIGRSATTSKPCVASQDEKGAVSQAVTSSVPSVAAGNSSSASGGSPFRLGSGAAPRVWARRTRAPSSRSFAAAASSPRSARAGRSARSRPARPPRRIGPLPRRAAPRSAQPTSHPCARPMR